MKTEKPTIDPLINRNFTIEIDGVDMNKGFKFVHPFSDISKIYTYYKLTDQNMQTYKGFQWKLGEWKQVMSRGELCTEGWLHCYSDPLLGLIMNSVHANINKPRLFQVSVKGKHKTDRGLKDGWEYMRLDKELEIPKITKKILININKKLCVFVSKGSYKYPFPINIKTLLFSTQFTLAHNIDCMLTPPYYFFMFSTQSSLDKIIQILHSVIEGENS